jgi:hypothetical protein
MAFIDLFVINSSLVLFNDAASMSIARISSCREQPFQNNFTDHYRVLTIEELFF